MEPEIDWVERAGQYYSAYDDSVFCFICGRATDHLGEHTDAQITEWKATRC